MLDIDNHQSYLDMYIDFCDDEEKMRDFFYLSKKEFLESYSYMTEEEWLLTLQVCLYNNRKRGIK